MRIRKSMIATAVLLAMGVSGQAWSQNQNEHGPGDNNATNSEDYSGNNRNNDGLALAAGLGNAAANNNSSATTNVTNSFNTNKAIARTELVGVVSGNAVYGIGNAAGTIGDASGGDGGNGGHGLGGIAVGGYGEGGDGGNGGDALSVSARDGDSGSTNLAGALGLSGADADAHARTRERGAGSASADADATADSTADADANTGDATSSNDGSSGDAMADGGRGGNGGRGRGGDATGGAGTGGNGGRAGDGGTVSSDAGSFDMSNAMNGSANAAAGIMVVAQNSGASSLIQQGVTVQANLNVGGGP